MCKKQKIRLAIKIIITNISFIAMSVVIMFLIVSVSVLAATSKSTENNIRVISKKDTAKATQTINRIEEPIRPKKSTMQRMVRKKEVVKGDWVEEFVRKAKIRKIREAQRKRRQAQEQARLRNWLRSLNTPNNVQILAHLINGEAGDQSDECQQAVGQVVLNRVRSEKFKQDTIESVVFSHGQYACTWDGNYDKEPTEQAYKNAKAVLTGNVCIKVPENVVYQSQFEQGSGMWKKIGTEIFCFE